MQELQVHKWKHLQKKNGMNIEHACGGCGCINCKLHMGKGFKAAALKLWYNDVTQLNEF